MQLFSEITRKKFPAQMFTKITVLNLYFLLNYDVSYELLFSDINVGANSRLRLQK